MFVLLAVAWTLVLTFIDYPHQHPDMQTMLMQNCSPVPFTRHRVVKHRSRLSCPTESNTDPKFQRLNGRKY
jgi:hypothetical protein